MVDARRARLHLNISELDQHLRHQPDDSLAQLNLLRSLFLTAETHEPSYTRGLRLSTQLSAVASLANEPIMRAYKAAFTAIGGRYTPWPLEQFSRASDASRQLDSLVQQHPALIELRFLRGVIYDRMPVIMLKTATAAEDLRLVTEGLIAQRKDLPSDFSTEMARYVADHPRVAAELKLKVKTLYPV